MSVVPDNARIRELTPDPNGGAQYGLEYIWRDSEERRVRLRIHGPDRGENVPLDSPSRWNDIHRIQISGRYQDILGNLYHKQVHNEKSPHYDEGAAGATHMVWPDEYPGLQSNQIGVEGVQMVGDRNLIDIVTGLLSERPPVREETCERICDWLHSFDRREVSVISSLLASAAVLEGDVDCRESELHALGELTETGFVEAAQLSPLLGLRVESLDVSGREYLSCLMSEYFSDAGGTEAAAQ